jgi:hypothetical protein
MYSLAGIVVTLYEQDSRSQPELAALHRLPEEERESIEERAAVLEFDAGMTRAAATRAAVASHLKTIKALE